MSDVNYIAEQKSLITGEWIKTRQFDAYFSGKKGLRTALNNFNIQLQRNKLPVDFFRLRREREFNGK